MQPTAPECVGAADLHMSTSNLCCACATRPQLLFFAPLVERLGELVHGTDYRQEGGRCRCLPHGVRSLLLCMVRTSVTLPERLSLLDPSLPNWQN